VRKEQSTADDGADPRQLCRVTHPFHPLYGREFRLVDLRQAWGEDRVYFHSEHGQLLRLPARWTNAKPEDAFVAVAAGRCRFRVDDLLRLADLVQQLREVRVGLPNLLAGYPQQLIPALGPDSVTAICNGGIGQAS